MSWRPQAEAERRAGHAVVRAELVVPDGGGVELDLGPAGEVEGQGSGLDLLGPGVPGSGEEQQTGVATQTVAVRLEPNAPGGTAEP